MWPFSTINRLKTEVWSAKQEAAELRKLLGDTQLELAKHKQLLAGRTGTMKVLRETATAIR